MNDESLSRLARRIRQELEELELVIDLKRLLMIGN